MHAQYTTAGEFSVRIETNVEYGMAINYMGYTDTLLLDLYKPVGDGNENRPLLVLIHGGAWIGGCKDEAGTGIILLANEFASRGYVVASVDYRLGWHKDDYVATPTSFPWAETYKSLYAADSAELIRALYRGMQDVKGAIRFLKGRNVLDSTCVNNVYVGGESAGAFVALSVAFLDLESEKPSSCFSITDAPVPQENLPNAVADCEYRVFTLNDSSLHRDDLGSVEGTLHTGIHNAKVKGVLSFFGGVPIEAFAKNWFDNNTDIPVYFYHQTCDGVVSFSYGQPMDVISYNCNLGYDPWHYNYPHMFGNGAIFDNLTATGSFELLSDFEYCDPFVIPLFDCIRYSDNGSYHYTSNVAQRAVNASEFLRPFIMTNENDAECKASTTFYSENTPVHFSIYPNPMQEDCILRSENYSMQNLHLSVLDISGSLVTAEFRKENDFIHVTILSRPGIYFLKIQGEVEIQILQLIKL
ncbi:MAG: T9SS type A sorting domain-containing protein [Chitinophagales bacterium]